MEKYPLFRQVSMVITLLRFRFWVGYTTSTKEWPERFNSEAELPEESAYRVPPCCFWSAGKDLSLCHLH